MIIGGVADTFEELLQVGRLGVVSAVAASCMGNEGALVTRGAFSPGGCAGDFNLKGVCAISLAAPLLQS